MLLIGSPMCTAFSAWQRINEKKRDPDLVKREYVRAMVHIRFTMELYQLQHAAGRYFLHDTLPRQVHGQNRLYDALRVSMVSGLLLEINASLGQLIKQADPSRSRPSS